LDETFGAVTPGGIELGIIALNGRRNLAQTFEFTIKVCFSGLPVQLSGSTVIRSTIRLSSGSAHPNLFSFIPFQQNPFMGFSDFRAAFTSETQKDEWSVTPSEGSLNGRGAPTDFVVKFKAANPAVSEGYLVIETEDDKWTWKLIGTGSM
jgi:hypothetical protein